MIAFVVIVVKIGGLAGWLSPHPSGGGLCGHHHAPRQVAAENGQYGIRVNCVSPSTILTENVRQQLTAERQQQWEAQHPLGRLGMPEDVALTTLFLASASCTGILQIGLDLLFWAGYLRNLIPLHMLIGLVLVLTLWGLAVLAWRAGGSLGFALLRFV